MSEERLCLADCDTKDEPCQHTLNSEGACPVHGEDGEVREGVGSGETSHSLASNGGPPENNGNAETHGLTAEREAWFERHREEAEPIVRALVESYVVDAPFGFENDAKVDLLAEVCIDQARLRKSNEVLDEFITPNVVGYDDDGEPIVKIEEHPAHLPRARIKRDNIRILKELGILDDPASQQAAATHDLADAARELAQEHDGEVIDV